MRRMSKVAGGFVLAAFASVLIGCGTPGSHADPEKMGTSGEHRFQEADLRSLERGDIFVITTPMGRDRPSIVLSPASDNNGLIYSSTISGFNFMGYSKDKPVDLAPKLRAIARKGTAGHEFWASRLLLQQLDHEGLGEPM